METDSISRDPTRRLTPVVTAFLSSGGQVMLARRSDKVGTYRGAWAGISGYVERLPLEQAFVEIEEEANLTPPDVELRGIGIPIIVEDSSLGRAWVVHPFLFDVANEAVAELGRHDVAQKEKTPKSELPANHRCSE